MTFRSAIRTCFLLCISLLYFLFYVYWADLFCVNPFRGECTEQSVLSLLSNYRWDCFSSNNMAIMPAFTLTGERMSVPTWYFSLGNDTFLHLESISVELSSLSWPTLQSGPQTWWCGASLGSHHSAHQHRSASMQGITRTTWFIFINWLLLRVCSALQSWWDSEKSLQGVLPSFSQSFRINASVHYPTWKWFGLNNQ